MPEPEGSAQVSPAVPASKRRYRWIVTIFSIILLTVGITYLIWWTLPKEGSKLGSTLQETITRQWNSTIFRLGIEPIYPPQEDISAGDIYLVIVNDALGGE